MLNIYLGDMENAIYHPPVYFDNTYEDEWITDELSVKMIKDIDKSDVIGPHLVQSPILWTDIHKGIVRWEYKRMTGCYF